MSLFSVAVRLPPLEAEVGLIKLNADDAHPEQMVAALSNIPHADSAWQLDSQVCKITNLSIQQPGV